LKKNKKKVLVIGEDSKIAKFLIPYLKKKNFQIISTTRRKKASSKKKIFLDLSKLKNLKIHNKIDTAVVLAGIDGNKNCEANYKYAYRINCIKIPELISKLLKKNIFVIYLSTSSVFKNKVNLPKESSKQNPQSIYGKLKSIAEKKILRLANKEKKGEYLSILRLTKNIGAFTSPFNNWIFKINKKKKFLASKDFNLAPITYEDTKDMIFKIIKNKYYGIHHLSGEREISYYDFAKKILNFNNLNKNLVYPSVKKENKSKFLKKNLITALNMNKTSKILKIKPIKIQRVIKLFSSKIN